MKKLFIAAMMVASAAAGCNDEAGLSVGDVSARRIEVETLTAEFQGDDRPNDPRESPSPESQAESFAGAASRGFFDFSATREGPLTRGVSVASVGQMTDLAMFVTCSGEAAWSSSMPVAKLFDERMVRGGATGRFDEWQWAAGDGVREMWERGSGLTPGPLHTFFCYAPFATGAGQAGNGIEVIPPAEVVTALGGAVGVPHVSYAVPAAVSRQPDLMIATRRENLRQTGNPVTMEMNHALTAVGFRVTAPGRQLVSVTLQGVRTEGIVALDGAAIAWDLSVIVAGVRQPAAVSPAVFTAPMTPDPLLADTWITAADGYLMMIPQPLPSGAKVTLTFGGGTPPLVFNLEGLAWGQGRRVIYRIDLTL